MPDREKVIKGLEVCVDREPGKYNCNECPYEIDGNWCEINLAKDALALLKDREPKPVKVVKNVYNHEFYFCPNCDREFYGLYKRPSYCDRCGQKVTWE